MRIVALGRCKRACTILWHYSLDRFANHYGRVRAIGKLFQCFEMHRELCFFFISWSRELLFTEVDMWPDSLYCVASTSIAIISVIKLYDHYFYGLLHIWVSLIHKTDRNVSCYSFSYNRIWNNIYSIYIYIWNHVIEVLIA